MHHALDIPEILLSIFAYCHVRPPTKHTSDLPALARTCRAFREPALDVLWETLDELSPLVRCVPDACMGLDTEVPQHELFAGPMHLFRRPPTLTEWETIRSYARRVRAIIEVRNRLEEECLLTLSRPPTAEPLFPNLRHLWCKYSAAIAVLLLLPFPSLVSLDLVFASAEAFRMCLSSFPDHVPNVRRLAFRVRVMNTGGLFGPGPKLFARWGNLEAVVCPQIALSAEALIQLSCIPSLARLTFTQMGSTFSEPLVFGALRSLTVYARNLSPITRMLGWMRVAGLTELGVVVGACPTRAELASFMAALEMCGACRVERLALEQTVPNAMVVVGHGTLATGDRDDGVPVLELVHLKSLRHFPLRTLKLDMAWSVGLRDADVLALVEGWVQLKSLVLNACTGWYRAESDTAAGAGGGVTLEGFRQLLEVCPELTWAALALDTRGAVPPPCDSTQCPARRGLVLDVVDSRIEAEAVEGIGAFLAEVAPGRSVSVRAWRVRGMVLPDGWDRYKERWGDVSRRVKWSQPLGQKCKGREGNSEVEE